MKNIESDLTQTPTTDRFPVYFGTCTLHVDVSNCMDLLSMEFVEEDNGPVLTLKRYLPVGKYRLNAEEEEFYIHGEELAAFRDALEVVCARFPQMSQARRAFEAPPVVQGIRGAPRKIRA